MGDDSEEEPWRTSGSYRYSGHLNHSASNIYDGSHADNNEFEFKFKQGGLVVSGMENDHQEKEKSNIMVNHTNDQPNHIKGINEHTDC